MNNKEKEALLEWARKQGGGKSVFEIWDAEKPSYYIERNEYWQDIIEYDFTNINELKALFDSIWRRQLADEIKKTIAIAIMKAEPEEINILDAEMDKGGSKIPEFIYIF